MMDLSLVRLVINYDV